MVQQVEITLTPKSRGFHLVTSEIMRQLPKLPKTGIINIFCKHTSCGLSINENADPDVRVDMVSVSKILGHANSRITEKVYAKMLPETIMKKVMNVQAKLI